MIFAKAMLAAVLFTMIPAPVQATASQSVTAWLSTYDYWNNSPPGYGIEYPKDEGYHTVHNWACCRNGGTYANPITFASQPNELSPGTRIYIPYFKRYFIKEDDCTGCYTNKWQFDLWVGGVSQAGNDSQSPHSIVNLWEQRTVIINPPKNEPVVTNDFAQVRI